MGGKGFFGILIVLYLLFGTKPMIYSELSIITLRQYTSSHYRNAIVLFSTLLNNHVSEGSLTEIRVGK